MVKNLLSEIINELLKGNNISFDKKNELKFQNLEQAGNQFVSNSCVNRFGNFSNTCS